MIFNNCKSLHHKYLVDGEVHAEELGSVQACRAFPSAGIHGSVFDSLCKASANVITKKNFDIFALLAV